MTNQSKLRRILVVCTLLALLIASLPMFALANSHDLDPDTQFYTPKWNHGAIVQIADLTSSGDKATCRSYPGDDRNSPGGMVHQRQP